MSAYRPASVAYTVTLDERPFAVAYHVTPGGTAVAVDGVIVSRRPLGPTDVHRFVLADLEVRLAATLAGPAASSDTPGAFHVTALTLSLDGEVVLEDAPVLAAA